ncbi:DNA photolyase family protein [Staphylococcus hyicus]|uniref:cryptochrome/photolyase family protein n=1 Tax=Staphylococcus hyicus TaxID=1284 RepID=UPI00217D985C|nr:deoxyribodipyrimidine photo-lyase [Staphylococcus hyicus]UWF56953.1 DNA photolyase family protein [Staphylococcus hyicus]
MKLGVILNRVFRMQANPLFQYVSEHHHHYDAIHFIVPIEAMTDASEIKYHDYMNVVKGFLNQLKQYDIEPHIVTYEALGDLSKSLGLTHVLLASDTMSYHHERYDFPHIQRAFQNYHIDVIGLRANHYFNPRQTTNKQGEPYKVFTHFYKANRSKITHIRTPNYTLETLSSIVQKGDNQLNLTFNDACDVEATVRAKWEDFLREDITQYKELTHDLTQPYVSGMSRSLAYGLMDIHEVLSDLLEGYETSPSQYEAYMRELIFREFYYVLMVAYPHTAHQSFNEKYRDLSWSKHEATFEAWKNGETGYPIVDAAMKKLRRTGCMHNRLRMVVSQFLTKHLLINWTWGEAYFREQLIDYDNASNVHGWQWSASTGTDAVPYFRMFNPIRQSERFDAQGYFVKSEFPLFDDVPAQYIHHPSAYREVLNETYHIKIGEDYPDVIVDHKASRERVMTVFKSLSEDEKA